MQSSFDKYFKKYCSWKIQPPSYAIHKQKLFLHKPSSLTPKTFIVVFHSNVFPPIIVYCRNYSST